MSSKQWLDQSTSIRKGEELDIPQLEKYLLANLPESEGSLEIEQFPSGFSNLTYLLKLGEKQMVLRRPPFGAKIKSGHDMSREFRILSALKNHYPKVPKPLLFCEDHSILGADFYLMERVQGVILRAKMPKEMHPDPTQMAAIGSALVDTFVELHNIDYNAVGLGDLGRPEGYALRQIEGWTRRYLKAKTDDIPQMDKVAKWLADNVPAKHESTLIHNDFKYDNLILNTENWAEVICVLDWEMATIGDPMMDLGTSLGYWVDSDDPPVMQMLQLGPTTLPGNPSRRDVAQRYAELSGRSMDDIVFYYVYGLFKIAIIVQQIYARYKKGLTKDERFAMLIHAVSGCSVIAESAIEKQRIDQLF